MILVTGAGGHLGANLVRRLLRDGEAVRVLIRGDRTVRPRALEGLAVERAFGDLGDAAAVRRAVEGCERIYHCAARVSTTSGRKHEIYRSNVLGTRHVLDAARRAGAARVVVTGSFSATGEVPGRPSTEDDPFRPFARHTPYTVSKVLVEHECLRAAAAGLDVVIATSTAIIGPHDYGPSRMGRLLLDFAHGRLRAYLPGGFEFVSAADLVEGHLLAMRHGRPGRKYLLSTQFRTVDELMDLYSAVCGVPKPALRVPPALMAAAAHVAEPVLSALAPRRRARFSPAAIRFLRSQRRADCSRAVTELGYRPTDIAAAVEQAYACFVRRRLIDRPRSAAAAPLPKRRTAPGVPVGAP
ncbi:NAD-dependent epimerase/dehydratase family protein [Streptomyces sp. URMC 123]|uniref:NAD-dependent epimerase/dehydratase family protein n=1 Tax=Streptomyces sp. URMC 123 TaxID=3423403 RepID=UPI003F1B2A9E